MAPVRIDVVNTAYQYPDMKGIGESASVRSTALATVGPGKRLSALLEEEKKLTQKVARARATLEKLQLSIQNVQADVERQSSSSVAECASLDEQIHDVFIELLAASGKLGKRAKKKVRGLYLELQRDAAISDRRSDAEKSEEFDDVFGDHNSDFAEFTDPPQGADSPAMSKGPIHKGREQESSKSLFRKLADVLHPDKRSTDLGDAESAHRDTAMKEATAAYSEGNIAHLMRLEKAWLAGTPGAAAVTALDLDARCNSLQERIDELVDELSEVRDITSFLRNSPFGEIIREIKKFGSGEVMKGLRDELDRELASMKLALHFANEFRHGRISLEAFLQGPDAPDGFEDPSNVEDLFLEMEAMMASLNIGSRRQATSKKKRAERR